MKGPAVFLAQFMSDVAPLDYLTLRGALDADAGKVGGQIPTWPSRCIDLTRAAESQDYCDELAGTCREAGIEITELSTHLQGQLVAVHPADDVAFDAFAPDRCSTNGARRTTLPICSSRTAPRWPRSPASTRRSPLWR